MELGRFYGRLQDFTLRFREKAFFERFPEFFRFYRRRCWLYSYFSLLFVAVPVYLLIKAVSSFSAMTFAYLFLCLLLSVTWVAVPALFVFYDSGGSKVKRGFAWLWVVLAAVSCVVWGILFS